MTLPRRAFGRTGLTLSALGLGGAPLGDLAEKLAEPDADAVLRQALAEGIDYFDTAPWYGHGLSEHRVGRGLRAQARDSFVLSTKVGRVYTRPRDPTRFTPAGPWVGGLPFELRFDYRRDGVLRSYEDSLQRLGLARVDLLAIHDLDSGYHRPDALAAHRADLEKDGWRALESLRATREVRGVGAGINDRAMLGWFLERFDLDFVLVAMPYTLLDPAALPELAACAARGIAVVIGSPFASGILATGPREGATYGYVAAGPRVLERARRIESVCTAHGVPLAAAALQFPLAHPSVASVIPGATRAELVSANVAHLSREIPDALWSELAREGLLDEAAPTPRRGWQLRS